MKKKILFFTIVFSLIFVFTFCNKTYNNINSSLYLVPYDIDSFLALDFEKGRKSGLFGIIDIPKFYSENFNPIKEFFGNYEQFVEKTDIDFKKSVKYMILADGKNEKGAIIGVNHEAQKLKSFFERKGIKLKRVEKYKLDFYTSEHGFSSGEYFRLRKLSYASYKGRILIVGDLTFVKSVVDNIEKSGKGLLDNEKIKVQLKRINEDSVLWGIINLGRVFNDIASQNINIEGPLSIKDLSVILFHANYNDKKLNGQIKTISNDISKNKKIVDFLNGLKAVFSMGEGEFSKLFEHMNFTSQKDEIILNFSVPEKILIKILKNKSESK